MESLVMTTFISAEALASSLTLKVLIPLPASTLTTARRPSSVPLFAGLTPGFTGLYQVNAYVPVGVAPGDNVPLVITQGDRSSPAVSIAVR